MNQFVNARIYLDSNVIIYAIEGLESYKPLLIQLFRDIDSGKTRAITSELTLCECLVKPYRENRSDIVDAYSNFLSMSDSFHIREISRDILIDAAKIRAQDSTMKLPDAMHLATAISEKCSFFITNDKGIRSSHVQVVYLDSLL